MQKAGILLAAYSAIICAFVVPATGSALSFVIALGGTAGLLGGMLLAQRHRGGLALGLAGVLTLFSLGSLLLVSFVAAAIADPSLEGPRGLGTPILPLAKFAIGQLLFTIPSGAVGLTLRRRYYEGRAQAA